MNGRNLLVDALSVTFGVGAWVAINGLWVELPLLVQELPEGWSLPSYISIVTQMSNIGLIAYTLLRLCRPSLQQVPVLYVILFIGCVSSVLLSVFWDKTTVIRGEMHSVSLLCLVFFLALVDCTSSVLYIPYMATWRDIYLPSYLIGEGLSGFLPALVALGQGIGGKSKCQNVTIGDEERNTTWGMISVQGKPNFSVDVFFYILFIMMAASALSFILLEHLPSIQGERVNDFTSRLCLIRDNLRISETRLTTPSMVRKTFFFLLFLQGWSSMLSNGLLPSIQSYSCGPYGNITYHAVAILSSFANPLAAFFTMILKRNSPNKVGLLAVLGTGLASYIFATALLSPSPPLRDSISGSLLIVFMWTAFVGIITYVRVEIANLLREVGASYLFWSGMVTQIGSVIGAVVSFILVNEANIFESYDPCNSFD